MLRPIHPCPQAITFTLLAVAAVAVISGCAGTGTTQRLGTTITRAEQQAMTPDQALERLVAGNERFAAGKSLLRDHPAQVRATADSQHPFAVVLACIDSRTTPEIIFDHGLGKLFVPRIAGNYVQTDLLGSMEFATAVAGAKLIVVLGHTSCGAINGACDGVELGNLTTVMNELRPAVESVQGIPGERNSQNAAFVAAVTEQNVHLAVQRIRTDSPIIRELEQNGQVKIVGAIYDNRTGVVEFLSDRVAVR